MDGAEQLLLNISKEILNPLIYLMFSVALLVFLWGLFQFIQNADSEEGRETGKQHLLWGLVGMFIMLSVFALINLIGNTIGADTPSWLK